LICLIRPPAVEALRFSTLSVTPPLGLAYIAGALEAAGHEPQVLDAVIEAPECRSRYFRGYLIGLPLEEVAERIPAETTIVGITVVFTHEWPAVSRLIDLIKAARPDCRVVIGGEHVTAMPEFSLRTSRADVVVLGEGEETIVALVDALQEDRLLAEVDGIIYREGDRIVKNRRRDPIRDVDGIAWPAWHRFDLQAYYENRFVGSTYTGDVTVPVLATRGCPFQCTFCAAPNMWRPRWFPRDPKLVVDEIQHYVETYGARSFPFQDLTAIVRKDWIVAFCRDLIERDLDISWQMPSGTRSEAVDAEVADLLKRSGMVNMAYAPESGSEETRRLIKKQVRTDRLFDSVRAAGNAGLSISVFIIIGFPHDTRELVRENIAFLKNLAAEGVTDISVSFDMALPGTELFNSLYEAGKIRIDRKFFGHTLSSLAPWPTTSFCEDLGWLELMYWKYRLYLAFYVSRRRGAGRVPVVDHVKHVLSGLRAEKHSSRMQTAMRNTVQILRDSIAVHLKKGWMPRAEERRMFEGWDEIYREICEAKRKAGDRIPFPTDTRELHLRNVVPSLDREHYSAGALGSTELVS
jgi:radical SAM superfamily enzyme YgiQ (UPF0313 family)